MKRVPNFELLIVVDFKFGTSVKRLSKKYRLTMIEVEEAIRQWMNRKTRSMR
jgi:Mor family transcriptional regulator